MIKLNGKGFEVEPNWSGKLNGINAGYLAHGKILIRRQRTTDFSKIFKTVTIGQSKITVVVMVPTFCLVSDMRSVI